MTFVRGTDERAVLAGLGVDPDDAIRPDSPEFSSTLGVTLVRSGEWLVALETAAWPRGIRPDVLPRLSAGTEVVVVFEDIGKLNHEFAHAVDGQVITAVTTTAPPNWGGTQPDRLRPLAEELGMQHRDGSPSDSDYDLGDLEILLLIAETAVGLSLDEADLNSPLLKVPDQPADPTPRPPADARPAPLVSSAHLRPHVQRLLDSGVTADAIAAQAPPALSTNAITILLGEKNVWIPVKNAQQILAVADAAPAPLVSSAQLRPHVQRLLDSGATADAIAGQAGPALSTNAVNVLLGEANFWVPATIAEQILAIEVPPNA
jgi:PIN domain nuclease of toxin-antitoxin system